MASLPTWRAGGSLNSSRREAGIRRYIKESLRLLRAECPDAYFLMCGQLAPRCVLLRIEGEAVLLGFDPAGVHVLAARHAGAAHLPAVELTTTRQTILDVIDARLTLAEAVLSDAILLKGHVDDLAIFHEGLITYLRGAVRCPSFPPLLDSFRYEPR